MSPATLQAQIKIEQLRRWPKDISFCDIQVSLLYFDQASAILLCENALIF